MNDSRLASRYAKALFSLAREKNLVGPVRDDLTHLMALLVESKELNWLLETPVVNGTEKAKLAGEAFEGMLQPVTLEFLKLLIHHRRESNLASTCRMFMELYRADQGIIDAKVVSAVPVDPEFVSALGKRIGESSGRKVEMTTETREELIGGFILTLEDQQLDASVQSKLKRIRQELREIKK